jgi:hypothetical protein
MEPAVTVIVWFALRKLRPTTILISVKVDIAKSCYL